MVTELLGRWRSGDDSALKQLIPMIYGELKRLARLHMSRERAGHTLQPTALVHEVFERLVAAPRVNWKNRSHFFAICAQLLRRVLVDHARSRGYLKRGGGVTMVSLADVPQIADRRADSVLAIHEALKALTAVDARKGKVVELRFFGGLTIEETAAVLDVSTDTVLRDWNLAKSFLRRELRHGA